MKQLNSFCRTFIPLLLIQLILTQPLVPLFSLGLQQVEAAEQDEKSIADYQYDSACLNAATLHYTGQAIPDDLVPAAPQSAGTSTDSDQWVDDGVAVSDEEMQALDEDNTGELPFYVVNLTEIRENEAFPQQTRTTLGSKEYADEVITALGSTGLAYYKVPASSSVGKADDELLVVCRNIPYPLDPGYFNPFLPKSPLVDRFVAILNDPTPKIKFANPLDRYYLLGETCEGGLIPRDQWTEDPEDPSPCPGFRPEDDVISNGQWDAPKVDERVLKTLLYLVTPTEQGGAGREYIRVKKLVQGNKDNTLNAPTATSTATADDAAAADGVVNTSPDQLVADDGATSNEERDELQPSSYWIDPTDPPHMPKKVATSVMIDQIDKVRVATKITEQRTLGNDTIRYKTQAPFPVEVAWQSDDGLAAKPPPDFSNLSMLESSRLLVNATIVQMLNQYGLGDLELDVTEMDVDDFSDVALIVGRSLLEQLMGSPRGSMKGYDIRSVLKSIGLSYVEQELGLVPGSLADSNPLDKEDKTFTNFVRDIGRRTVEYTMKLPKGALRSDTGLSVDILESIGRSSLETRIFRVTEGTFLPLNELNTVSDLLERLGEGRMEYVFQLPRQSLRVPDYVNEDASKSFRDSSFKMTLLFPNRNQTNNYTEDDYAMADWVADKLSLAYVPYTSVLKKGEGGCEVETGCPKSADTNMYGFTAQDFQGPVMKLVKGEMSLQKFKQLVGSRVIETSLGIFRREASTDGLPKTGESFEEPVPTSISVNLPNGITLNPRYRPVYETKTTRTLNYKNVTGQARSSYWCGFEDSKIVSFNGSFDDAKAIIGSVDSIDKLTQEQGEKLIEILMNRAGSLSNRHFSDSGNVPCAQNPEVARRASFTAQIEDVLFADTEIRRMVFLNHDKAPKFENLNSGDGGNTADEDLGMGRYNVALMLFYNLSQNHKEVTLNGIAPYKPTTSKATDTDGNSVETSEAAQPIALGSLLNTMVAGGSVTNADGTNYTWPADSTSNPAAGVVSLSSRIQMLKEKTDSQKDLFNLDVLRGDIPRDQLNSLIIDRLNELTKRPTAIPGNPDSFMAQYQDPNYNGWLYLIQDMRERMRCKAQGGTYTLNQDKNGFVCLGLNGTITADASYYAKQALKLMDELYRVPWTLMEELLGGLNNGTVNDPTWDVQGGSMYSAATALASQAKRFADGTSVEVMRSTGPGVTSIPVTKGNWVFSKNDAEAVYSQDLVRSLVAPRRTSTGVVDLNQSVKPFFTRYATGQPANSTVLVAAPSSVGRSGLGEVGRIHAARAFDSDALQERTFVAQLKTDFAEDIDRGEDLANAAKRFENAVEESKDIVPAAKQEEKGLRDGDFSRIFQLDEANTVYERVGKEELLRAVWQRTGAAQTIKSSEQYQSIVRQTRQVTDSFIFYAEHIEKIQKNMEEIADKTAALGTHGDEWRKEIQKIVAENRGKDAASLREIQRISRSYEPVLTRVLKIARAEGQAGVAILELVEETMHLTQEVVAGKALPRQNNPEIRAAINEYGKVENKINDHLNKNTGLLGGRTDKSTAGPCFDRDRLVQVFSSGGEISTLLEYAAVASGTCQAENTLGMPPGSLLNWYMLGKQQWPPIDDAQYVTSCVELEEMDYDAVSGEPLYRSTGCPSGYKMETRMTSPAGLNPKTKANLFEPVDPSDPSGAWRPKKGIPAWKAGTWNGENFKLAVGFTVVNRQLESDKQYKLEELHLQTEATIRDMLKRGETTINATVLAHLVAMLPGVGDAMQKYQVTADDFAMIMQGDFRPLIEKVGGGILDEAFSLPRGSVGELMYPKCYDNDGVSAPCDNEPGQPGRDANNVRSKKLAELGLRKLGLNVPGFPLYFDFSGKGSLAEKWGNATFTEQRRMVANSFKGTITTIPANPKACKDQPLWCKNSAQQMLQAFGLDNHPYAKTLARAEQPMLQAVSASTTSAYEGGALIARTQKVKQAMRSGIKVLAFDRLRDPNYTNLIWGPTSLTGNAGADLQLADRAVYQEQFQKIWAMTATLGLSEARLKQVRKVLIESQGEHINIGQDEVPKFDEFWSYDVFPETAYITTPESITQNVSRYQIYIAGFRTNVTRLDQAYLGNGTPQVNFRRFLTGEIDSVPVAERIAELGGRYSVQQVLAQLANDWMNEQAPAWLKTVDQAFRNATKGLGGFGPSACGDGVGIGDFLSMTIIGTGPDCLKAISKISLDDLLTSTDSNFVNARLYLFDAFLGNSFAAQIEQDNGLTRGLLRTIVADPKNAQSILLIEGVTQATDAIFGKERKFDTCAANGIDSNCASLTLENATREALLAGFCQVYPANRAPVGIYAGGENPDPNRPRCSLNFSSSRATSKFNEVVNVEFDRQLKRVSKNYIGVEIDRADLSRFVRGDMKYIPLLAMQFTVNQLVQSLFDEDGEQKAMERFVTPIFKQVAAASGVGPGPAYQSIRDSEKPNAIQDLYRVELQNCTSGCTGLITADDILGGTSEADLAKKYEDLYVKNHSVGYEGDTGRELQLRVKARENYKEEVERRTEVTAAQKRKQAVEALQYAALDIVAFKYDSNIPADFSRRIFSGNSQEIISALAQWGFNSILNDKSAMGKILTDICKGTGNAQATECFKNFDALAKALFSADSKENLRKFYATDNGFAFVKSLDRGVTSYFSQQLGIALPEGVFEGIYVWGMHGFEQKDFNKAKLSTATDGPCPKDSRGCREGVPIGALLQTQLENRLFDWGDKMLGVKSGTVQKAAGVVRAIIDLQKVSAAYTSSIQQAQDLINASGCSGLSCAFVPGVKDKLKEASDLKKREVSLKAQIARLIADIIVSQFSEELSALDAQLELPPGMMSLIMGAALTYGIGMAFGMSGSAATAAAFGPAFFIALGISLVFGVTRVDVESLGTADGYYPFYSSFDNHGSGPATRCIDKSTSSLGGDCTAERPYVEHYQLNRGETGVFTTQNVIDYRMGLKKAAREKVRSLLVDLMLMQTSKFATDNGIDPVDLFPSQVFTYGGVKNDENDELASYDPTMDAELLRLTTNPAPWDDDAQAPYGYGLLENRCETVYDLTDDSKGKEEYDLTEYNLTEEDYILDGPTDGEEGGSTADTLGLDSFICVRQQDYRAGFFGIPNLLDAVHIRF